MAQTKQSITYGWNIHYIVCSIYTKELAGLLVHNRPSMHLVRTCGVSGLGFARVETFKGALDQDHVWDCHM